MKEYKPDLFVIIANAEWKSLEERSLYPRGAEILERSALLPAILRIWDTGFAGWVDLWSKKWIVNNKSRARMSVDCDRALAVAKGVDKEVRKRIETCKHACVEASWFSRNNPAASLYVLTADRRPTFVAACYYCRRSLFRLIIVDVTAVVVWLCLTIL